MTNLIGATLVILAVNITESTIVTNRVRGPHRPPMAQQFGTDHAAFTDAMKSFQSTNSTFQVRTNAGRTNFVIGVVTPDGQRIPLTLGR